MDKDKLTDRVEPLEAERVPRKGDAEPAMGHSVPLSRGRRRAALIVALAADALQWLAFPLFVSGALSPVVDVLDVTVGVTMLWLVGWHWAFLPTFIAELMPFVDLVPSWTLAWWIATRGKPEAPPAAR